MEGSDVASEDVAPSDEISLALLSHLRAHICDQPEALEVQAFDAGRHVFAFGLV